MQYLGSKSRISPWIIESIQKHLPNSKYVLDLFAGTGAVSIEAQKKKLVPYLNDIQPYSAILLNSIFIEKRNGITELIKLLKTTDFNKRVFLNGREQFKGLQEQEEIFFIQNQNETLSWKAYQTFCSNTQNKWEKNEILSLKNANSWNLFSNYYANTYFGVRQCLELDLVRQLAEELPSNLRIHLLGATVSAMSMCVSSTTHLAQYLKPSSKLNAINLITKRRKSIIEYVIENLERVKKYPISSKSIVTNFDYIESINFCGLSKKKFTIYADPPYFKEHYSRYYHVLDTFLLYDYPYLSWNPQINSVTTGLYRENRIVSEFGLKTKVLKAFKKLFENAIRYKFPVALSYADSSLVKKQDIIDIAVESNFDVKLLTKKLMHSGQGQKRNKIVIEYLFLCIPK